MNRLNVLLVSIFLFIMTLSSCLKTTSHQSKNEQETIVNLVLHDSITTQEAKALKEKIQQTSKRLSSDFNISNKEVFNVHVWKNYDNYLSAQEVNIGEKYPGSGGYVFSLNDLALHYNDFFIENAEHEFAHAASLHINNNFANNPRWLWEAVAIYEAGEFIDPKELQYLVDGNFPSLSDLNGAFSINEGNNIYKVGYILAEFIIEKWSRKKYLKLIEKSENWDKELGISKSDFEKQWKEYVTKKYLDEK